MGWRRVRLLVELPVNSADPLPLTDAQQHYLTRVLRLEPGAVVYPFDGQGNEARAELAAAPGEGPQRSYQLLPVGPRE